MLDAKLPLPCVDITIDKMLQCPFAVGSSGHTRSALNWDPTQRHRPLLCVCSCMPRVICTARCRDNSCCTCILRALTRSSYSRNWWLLILTPQISRAADSGRQGSRGRCGEQVPLRHRYCPAAQVSVLWLAFVSIASVTRKSLAHTGHNRWRVPACVEVTVKSQDYLTALRFVA